MLVDLKNKTALVTGSGNKNGIGYAIAARLAGCGANVVVADLPPKHQNKKTKGHCKLTDISSELAEKFNVKTLAVELDVTCNATIHQMVKDLKDQFDAIDILCNNAGTVFGVPDAIHTYDEDAWLKTIDVNLNGVFRISKAIVPLMMKGGGSIINIASRAAKVPPLFNGAYAVAKAGVLMLTKVMAKELAGSKIRVNAICPGVIRTDFTRWRFELEAKFLNSTVEAREAEMITTIPVGRLGDAEEVADLALFLASNASSYMTGQAINITGGQLMEF